MEIKTIYGSYEIEQPLIELINSPAIQRLKNIYMGGVARYIGDTRYKDGTRFEHSISVLALLIKYGASLNEQIAGLLHDASHTAFSHVGDVLFKGSQDKCYQDEIHEWYLKKQGTDKILEKYKISLSSILHKEGDFKRLEQELPDICIDRLEYNLSSVLRREMISESEFAELLDHLKFQNDKWFFDDLEIAKKFAKNPLILNEFIWAAPDNVLAYNFMAQALKLAVDAQIITNDDIHFSSDDIVWNKLKKAEDAQIIKILDRIENVRSVFVICSSDKCDLVATGKFRGIDPWVKTGANMARLTQLDAEFKQEFERVKNLTDAGWPIRFML
jgi:HD superfamily phosphohydrolase